MSYLILNLLRDLLRPRGDLLLENLALRQQINVLRRTNPKPPFSLWDKTFWVLRCRWWTAWRRPLALVKPQTVIALYVFVVLSLDRRRIVHVNVTTHPTAEWTALQLRQAFREIGSEALVITARSPWQNGYCERVVGTLKRECLNHMILLNENQARRVLKSYLEYYHEARTHLGLENDTPGRRPIEPPELGPVQRLPMVGGLHSRYYRQAA